MSKFRRHILIVIIRFFMPIVLLISFADVVRRNLRRAWRNSDVWRTYNRETRKFFEFLSEAWDEGK